MNNLFLIPQDKVETVVRSIMRQKAIIFIIMMVICVLLEIQGHQHFHLLGLKNLTTLESWLIVDLLMLIYIAFIASVAQKRFRAYFTSFRIVLTDQGIKKFNATDDFENDNNAITGIIYFAWNDITSCKEDSSGLKIRNGFSTLLPGVRQIAIPKQIMLYDHLKAEINTSIQ